VKQEVPCSEGQLKTRPRLRYILLPSGQIWQKFFGVFNFCPQLPSAILGRVRGGSNANRSYQRLSNVEALLNNFGEVRTPKKILITAAQNYAEETRYVDVRTANGQYGHGMERRELNVRPVPERA